MTEQTRTIQEVRAAVEQLIDRATNYDIEALECIYHEDLYITIVYPDNSVKTANKEEFIDFFKKRRDRGDAPMNRWAQWHHIHVNNDDAVVVMSRINTIGGYEMWLDVSIDLVFEDGRWQVIREEIFLSPLEY